MLFSYCIINIVNDLHASLHNQTFCILWEGCKYLKKHILYLLKH